MTSFALTPGGSAPLTFILRTFKRSIASVCVASTSRTWLVPMPKASVPNAPCVLVWLSPHASVMPGCVSPSCGPMTWTMPCLSLSRPKKSMPNWPTFFSSTWISSSACASRNGRVRTLYDKIWDSHTVDTLPTGQTQLFVGLHLIHEITTAPAFDMLRESGYDVAFPERTFATVDHIVPTDVRTRPFLDAQAEELIQVLEKNVGQFGIDFFGLDSDKQGIVHVIGPQLGLTQPGMTLACGDSHTSTHGAFGTLAFGIGTSQVRDVLATQTLAIDRLKVRRINVNGALPPGVYAKDVILNIIRKLGVSGGKVFAYEYGGAVLDRMNMEERMTVCNMSIEGGALVGYVNPDQTTFEFLRGRQYVPKGEAFDREEIRT